MTSCHKGQSVLPEFDLRVYQNPTGADFRMLNG
jgi:hypothetical protein